MWITPTTVERVKISSSYTSHTDNIDCIISTINKWIVDCFNKSQYKSQSMYVHSHITRLRLHTSCHTLSYTLTVTITLSYTVSLAFPNKEYKISNDNESVFISHRSMQLETHLSRILKPNIKTLILTVRSR
jgi:hypothetical protein